MSLQKAFALRKNYQKPAITKLHIVQLPSSLTGTALGRLSSRNFHFCHGVALVALPVFAKLKIGALGQHPLIARLRGPVSIGLAGVQARSRRV